MTDIASRADYADALLSLRRAKNWLASILIAIVAFQIVLFFAARYTNILSAATTQPSFVLLKYAVNTSTFVANLLTLLLIVVLLLIFNVMLVGRLLGLSRVTGAVLVSFILMILLFPWQGLLTFHGLEGSAYQIPGAAYTWTELVRDAKFDPTDVRFAPLKWARFLGFPFVCLILALMVQSKSRRGLKLALGESTSAGSTSPAAEV